MYGACLVWAGPIRLCSIRGQSGVENGGNNRSRLEREREREEKERGGEERWSTGAGLCCRPRWLYGEASPLLASPGFSSSVARCVFVGSFLIVLQLFFGQLFLLFFCLESLDIWIRWYWCCDLFFIWGKRTLMPFGTSRKSSFSPSFREIELVVVDSFYFH